MGVERGAQAGDSVANTGSLLLTGLSWPVAGSVTDAGQHWVGAQALQQMCIIVNCNGATAGPDVLGAAICHSRTAAHQHIRPSAWP